MSWFYLTFVVCIFVTQKLPFRCHYKPSTIICDNVMNDNIYKWYEKEMIIMQENNYCSISILFDREIDWKIIRLVYIAFYKNESNKNCFIGQLPKDLIKYIAFLVRHATTDKNMRSKRNQSGLDKSRTHVKAVDKVKILERKEKELNKNDKLVLFV